MTLRPATAADFGFIRGLTRDPAYAPFVGDTDEAGLAAWMEDPSVRVLIWGDRAGFAVFRQIGDPSGAVELFRLALARVNGGGGAAMSGRGIRLKGGCGRSGIARCWGAAWIWCCTGCCATNGWGGGPRDAPLQPPCPGPTFAPNQGVLKWPCKPKTSKT